jgi:hypothetical protein
MPNLPLCFQFPQPPVAGLQYERSGSVKLATANNKTFTSQVSYTSRGITDAKCTQRTVLLPVKYKSQVASDVGIGVRCPPSSGPHFLDSTQSKSSESVSVS